MEMKVAGIKSLLLGMTGRCADASGVPEHSFPLCFASVYPIRNGEWWREEGSIHTEKSKNLKSKWVQHLSFLIISITHTLAQVARVCHPDD